LPLEATSAQWKVFSLTGAEVQSGEYLFDLSTDQAEKNDLKTKEAKRLAKMKEKFDKWEKTVLPPVPF
jgi:hypothetical protein